MKKTILLPILFFIITSCSNKLFISYKENGKRLKKIDLIKLNQYAHDNNGSFDRKTFWSNKDNTSESYELTSKKGKSIKIRVSKKEGIYTHILKMELLENQSVLTTYYPNGNFKSMDIIKKGTIDSLLIDLRSNSGCSSKTAIEIAPNFECESFNGSNTQLSDLKGSYVYINVWATWSVPSKKEILAFNEIVEEFGDRNIIFVNISIDKAKDYLKWKKIVAEKNLKGLQLFDGQGFINSKFADDYKIYYIPRSILIGPRGIIISAFAPRPSNSELKKILSVM